MPGRDRKLESVCVVGAPLDRVFAFFSDARNLDVLTPPWLRFEILTAAPIEMRTGQCIDYRIRVRGMPMRWRSEITRWEPPHAFTDEQRRGPYRRWQHDHEFEVVPGGTRVIDRVRYRVAGGPLEPLIHRVLVGPDLRRIFGYRRERMLEVFGTHPDEQHLELRLDYA